MVDVPRRLFLGFWPIFGLGLLIEKIEDGHGGIVKLLGYCPGRNSVAF
jgi:hypothetical protein